MVVRSSRPERPEPFPMSPWSDGSRTCGLYSTARATAPSFTQFRVENGIGVDGFVAVLCKFRRSATIVNAFCVRFVVLT